MTDRIYTDDDGKPKPGVRERIALMYVIASGENDNWASAESCWEWVEKIELESRRRAAAEQRGSE